MSDVNGKTLTVSLGALVDGAIALRALLACKLPVKAGYHIAKLGKLVQAELDLYEERRQELIKSHGAEREVTEAEKAAGLQGPITEVRPEHYKTFKADLDTLRKQEVTLAWGVIPYAYLPAEMTGADLLSLDALVAPPVDDAP